VYRLDTREASSRSSKVVGEGRGGGGVGGRRQKVSERRDTVQPYKDTAQSTHWQPTHSMEGGERTEEEGHQGFRTGRAAAAGCSSLFVTAAIAQCYCYHYRH
jgi:hypothetical protein